MQLKNVWRPTHTGSRENAQRSRSGKPQLLNLTSNELAPTEKRQVMQLIDAFIERGQLKRKMQGAKA